MALKHKIDEDAFKKLSKELQGEYKKNDDGDYTLDVEGLDDTGALKRAKDHEKEQRKAAEKAAKEAQAKFDELQAEMEALRTEKIRGGDKVTEVEKAWQAKLAKREKELQDKVDASEKALKAQMVDAVANSMAAKLAGEHAEVLLPHIQRRLVADIVNGKAVTKIIGPDGEVSAMTLPELEKDFLSSDKFSAVVIGSKASGGGTGGQRKGASGTQKKKLSEMTATEEAIFARQSPEEYKTMIAAEGQTTNA